jgi:hypothetical protein
MSELVSKQILYIKMSKQQQYKRNYTELTQNIVVHFSYLQKVAFLTVYTYGIMCCKSSSLCSFPYCLHLWDHVL